MRIADLAKGSTTVQVQDKYYGPTLFEGIQIPQALSPNITVHQIIRQLDRSGFCSINVIGVPGSGKSETVNMLAHQIHTQKPEYQVMWLGSNELRHIKEFLQSLKKGLSYILIFDDTSNALDSLSGEELSEGFQSYTRGRHEVQGKLCPIMIYHYTKSHKKAWRSQSIFSIYLSSTPTEKGNIKELIRGDTNALAKFKQFQRLYRTSFSEEYFELDLGNGINRSYKDSDPFRIAYVLGPLGANLMLTMIKKCGHCAEKPLLSFLAPDDLLEIGKKPSYKDYALQALSLICWHKGEKDALPNDLRRTLDFYLRTLADANTDYHELATKVRATRKKQKRYYRPRKEEDEAYNEIMKKVTKKVIDKRIPEVRVLEAMDSMLPW